MPQSPVGSSQRSPRSPSWILRVLLLREEKERERGENARGGRGREKKKGGRRKERGIGPQFTFLVTQLSVGVSPITRGRVEM